MPIGITTDIAVTFLGACVGCLVGQRLTNTWKKLLNNMLGMAAIVMGIVLITRGKNLSPVILALLLGAACGEIMNIEGNINKAARALASKLPGGASMEEAQLAQVSAALILFCFGGTGWYGALNEGMTGDGSILVTKAILDGVTACIFAAMVGGVIPALCGAQLVVYFALYGVSGFVGPYITPTMIGDFSALGGIITLIAGLKLSGIKTDITGLNLLPGLILVFFLSAGWVALFA